MDFKQAEEKFKQLKAQFEAGALSENAFKAKLEELMIRDEHGDWWMIGYETERWYRNDGTDWVQSDPPGSIAQESTGMSEWIAMFLITLGWVIGGAIGGAIYWEMGDYVGSAIGGATAWGIGGLVVAIILRNKRVLSNWNNMLWITLAWAVGGSIGWPVGEALTEASGAAVGWAIGAAIGGFITVRIEHILPDWKSILWTTLALAIGGAIGWTIASIIQFDIDGAIGWPIGMAVSGGIGGFILARLIKKR